MFRGRSACFARNTWVGMPFARKRQTSADAGDSGGLEMELSKRVVVLVGQNNAGRRALQLALSLEGYGVHAADTAWEGRVLIDKHWPEAVVLDVAEGSPEIFMLGPGSPGQPPPPACGRGRRGAPVPARPGDRRLRGRLRRLPGPAQPDPRADRAARQSTSSAAYPTSPRRPRTQALELVRGASWTRQGPEYRVPNTTIPAACFRVLAAVPCARRNQPEARQMNGRLGNIFGLRGVRGTFLLITTALCDWAIACDSQLPRGRPPPRPPAPCQAAALPGRPTAPRRGGADRSGGGGPIAGPGAGRGADHPGAVLGLRVPVLRPGGADLAALEAAYPGKIRVVWKNFPLDFHANARAGRPGGGGGRRAGQVLGDARPAAAGPASAGARRIWSSTPGALGLDLGRFRASLNSPATDQVVEADLRQGRALGVNGHAGACSSTGAS